MSTSGRLQRVEGAVEQLDAPGADPGDIRQSLDDLERINRLFLGTRLTLGALEDLLRGRGGGSLSVLDAGCGGGDMAAAIARWARARGFVPRVVGVDASPAIAALAFDRVGGDVEVRVGDMRRLELDDAAVDVATCSLVVHHFEPGEAVEVLRELRRVARAGVVVNDLVRTRIGLLGAQLVARTLAQNAITRHDAVLSVRRAYTRAELVGLLHAAGLEPLRVRGALGYRVAIPAVPR